MEQKVTPSTREELKVSAFLRAQLALKHANERIDFAFDVISPTLAEMRELAKANKPEIIEAGEVTPYEEGDEDQLDS